MYHFVTTARFCGQIARLYDLFIDGKGDGLSATRHMELFINRGHVLSDGVCADVEQVRDAFVGVAIH